MWLMCHRAVSGYRRLENQEEGHINGFSAPIRAWREMEGEEESKGSGGRKEEGKEWRHGEEGGEGGVEE